MFLPRIASLALFFCAACAASPEPVTGPAPTQIWSYGTQQDEVMDRDWIPPSFYGAAAVKTSDLSSFEATNCKKAFEHEYQMLAIALVENRGRQAAGHYLRRACAEWSNSNPRPPLRIALRQIARKCRADIGLGTW